MGEYRGEEVCFPLHYCRHLRGGGLIWGRTPVCRARPMLTHVKRKRQQVDKSYSHMKTEWISRLNFFSRGYAYGLAEPHCSTPARPQLLHSNISLSCYKLQKSEKFQTDFLWYFMFCIVKKTSTCRFYCRRRTWHQLITDIWIILPFRVAASSCQIISSGMPKWPSSISCQADLPAWEQATQLSVLIIKRTEYLTHALSFESLVLTSQVQSSFRSKRTRLKHELMSAQWEENSLHAAESSIRSTAAAFNS